MTSLVDFLRHTELFRVSRQLYPFRKVFGQAEFAPQLMFFPNLVSPKRWVLLIAVWTTGALQATTRGNFLSDKISRIYLGSEVVVYRQFTLQGNRGDF